MNAEPLVSGTSWPLWTNPRIRLYHGTVMANANAIVKVGVDILKGRQTTDFGRGFYATTDKTNANEWARRKSARLGSEPAVVLLELDRVRLGRLQSIVFIRGSLHAAEYWSFVSHCRRGLPHRPRTGDFYDVAYGPVAKIWDDSANSATWDDYDQIGFHTRLAQDMLNDRDVCTLEVMI